VLIQAGIFAATLARDQIAWRAVAKTVPAQKR
jgi:hypothetical protein